MCACIQMCVRIVLLVFWWYTFCKTQLCVPNRILAWWHNAQSCAGNRCMLAERDRHAGWKGASNIWGCFFKICMLHVIISSCCVTHEEGRFLLALAKNPILSFITSAFFLFFYPSERWGVLPDWSGFCRDYPNKYSDLVSFLWLRHASTSIHYSGKCPAPLT